MKKLQPIICLPTDKASNLFNEGKSWEFKQNPETVFNHFTNGDWRAQFLYILSSEPIKEGDWMYDEDPEKGLPYVYQNLSANEYYGAGYYKIIATSNPEIVQNVPKTRIILESDTQIAKLPLSLIEYYAKYQPKEVAVEYERELSNHSDEMIIKLKLTQSGEICMWDELTNQKKK